jgi:phosphoribosylformylglycinamidine cyclo-ligase
MSNYRDAGVDIDAANETVRRIRALARRTFTPAVLSDIGSFGGLFRFDASRGPEPVLVASADGVGTKLKIAVMMDSHRTVGVDLVNHCVNDILVQGAEPLFFLDYFATGRLAPQVVTDVVEGLSKGCSENGCALLGGETAEMPGFYADGDYDLAGFIVGTVDRSRLIDGSRIEAGDVLIGLPSSGLHTNGYSLARQIVFERLRMGVDAFVPELGGRLGDVLLQPHRTYLPLLRGLLPSGVIKGAAHITGGGMTDNIPRILPTGAAVQIHLGSWPVPPVFTFLRRSGDVPLDDMLRTFNMGIGMVVVVAADAEPRVLQHLRIAGEPGARRIGEVITGGGGVHYDE